MDKLEVFFWGMVILLSGAFLVAGLLLGETAGKAHMREEAVSAGVAEWVVVDTAGNTEFRWLEPALIY